MYKPGVDSVVTIRSQDRLKAVTRAKLPQRIRPRAPVRTAAPPASKGTPPSPPWVGPGPMPGPPGPAGLIGDIDYSMLPIELSQVPISFPFSGKPLTYAAVNVPMAFALIIPAGLAGTRVYEATLPTLNPVFVVNRISGDVVSQLGTVTIMPAGNTACFLEGDGGELDVGDVLQIVAPVQDATLADLGITILTMRV